MPEIDLRMAVNSVQDYVTDSKDILGNNLDDFLIEETEKYFILGIISLKRSRV